MLGRARLTLADVVHEFRKSLSRRRTTSCRGDCDTRVLRRSARARRGVVHTGHGARGAAAGWCHARRPEFLPMITRLLALLLLAATALATAAPQAPALVLAPEAADWKALACAALVALYVARRRSHWRAG